MIQSVIITKEAYKQIFTFVIEFANPERPYRNWKEVIGWLIGTIKDETITILKAIPMTSGSSIFVEMTDYAIIPKIAEEAEQNNAVIVGWFHSHPSFGFFLSGIDIRTQRYQQNLFEDAIALVCDPTKVNSIEAGIHGFQVYLDTSKGREYRELDITVELDNYPEHLEEILAEAGTIRSYSDVIAFEELAELYALEGISPPYLALTQVGELLPSEKTALPLLTAEIIIPESIFYKKESFFQIKISNIGEGIAFMVDLILQHSYDYEIISMYPHRIIDQLNYDSTISETFKIKPVKKLEMMIPSISIYYRAINQQKYQIIIPSKMIKIKEMNK